MSNTETYIVSAKTVDEAMAIAQREYGGAGRDISFDILEMPKKGFLGLGAKDAKIKVTVTEEEINLGSIVAEMKSYRMQTDREGSRDGGKEEKPKQPKPERQPKPEAKAEQKPAQPKAEPKPERQPKPEAKAEQKPAQPKAEPKPERQPKPEAKAEQKPAQPKAEPKPERQSKPEVKAEQKPAQPKAEPKPERQPKPEAKAEQKPVQPKAEPKADQKPEKPAFDTSKAGEKPVKKEAQATGILDNMPEYKIDENAKKTPVYKETGANVKTYSRSPMQTAAVADGSIYSGDTPVADVRWDSARDLKKAEEAAAAAIAAAAPKAVDPIKASEVPDKPVKESAPVKEAPAKEIRLVEEPADEEYIPSDGSIDVAALDAAIEAMVEDLPAPESRKKVGVTAAEMEHALDFVTTLLANMQIDAKAVALPCPEGEEYEVTEDADIYPAMEIVGDGTGILIGHHGETLDAIQYLLNLAAIRHSDNPAGDYVKISLDIENYRAKREETLRSLARRMAARALKYKRNVFLEPMNAYERRIIHSELQSVENVSTHSVGTDKNRKIIITYEGPDKVFDDRRRLSDKPEGGNNRRDRKRRGDKHSDKPEKAAETAELPEEPMLETAEENAAEKPAGEHKSRSRNRNRNRNRNRRRAEGENAAEGTVSPEAEAPVTGGAAAIISGEEREEIDRQLSDPANRSEKKPQPKPAEDIPEFLRQPAAEPVEHLREN